MSAATPAFAQAWIGEFAGRLYTERKQAERESACMYGKIPERAEIDEAINSADNSMQFYWKTVRSRPTALLGSMFHKGKGASWSIDNDVIAITPYASVVDPFAADNGNSIIPGLRFILAGDEATARGRWFIKNREGRVIGAYDAILKRSNSVWRFWQLKLITTPNALEPLVQYCHQLGDVQKYRFKLADMAHADAVKWETRQMKRALQARALSNIAVSASENAKPGKPQVSLSEKSKLAIKAAEDAENSAAYARLSSARAAATVARVKAEEIVDAYVRMSDVAKFQ